MLDLDIELLVGAHGALEGRPYQSLIDFTEIQANQQPTSPAGVSADPTETITHTRA